MELYASNYPPLHFRPLQTNIHMQLADFIHTCRNDERYAYRMVRDDTYALTLMQKQTEWLTAYVQKLAAEWARLLELDGAFRAQEEPGP